MVAGQDTSAGTVDTIAECPAALLASFLISSGKSFWEAAVGGVHEEGEGSEGSGKSQMASLWSAGPFRGPQLLVPLLPRREVGSTGSPVGREGGGGPRCPDLLAFRNQELE